VQHLLGDALSGAPLIVHHAGCYQLNVPSGVETDVARFDVLVQLGNQQYKEGNPAATTTYHQALGLYRGDLYLGNDLDTVITREHLRAHYLALLLRLATIQFDLHDYRGCEALLQQLLSVDRCYEQAHRLLMRCYVRLGERSVALRHYQVCTKILRSEFDIIPEPDTMALFDQIRLEPGNV
jgi:DNA-binding SARP family transcriptional activator